MIGVTLCVYTAPAPEYWNKGGIGSFLGARLVAEPPAGFRGRAPGQGVRGRSPPPEAERFLALGRATDRANLYPLQYFQQSITIR